MVNFFLIFLGKLFISVSKFTNRGNGSTWPGHIALSAKQNFLKEILLKNPALKVIFIVGTNGKTTTGKMITTILEKKGKKVFQNTSGANLLNGIASSFIAKASLWGKVSADYAIFEIDENTLTGAIKEITPFAVIALNLFRDQLDRYGELDSIAKKWKEALATLPESSKIILNADDPQMAFLGMSLSSRAQSRDLTQKISVTNLYEIHPKSASSPGRASSLRTSFGRNDNIFFFGLEKKDMKQKTIQHGADSIYCPNCHAKLEYSAVSFSHLGLWKCSSCKFKHPESLINNIQSPLPGLYNSYNTAAALTFAQIAGISQKEAQKSLEGLTPAFGRQEKIFFEGKQIQLFLAKNPTSFNQSLRTVVEMGGEHILFVLNDRIPDGRDVSWIWDIDLESHIELFKSVIISGDRAYDMGLRVSYAFKGQKSKVKSQNENSKSQIFENLEEAVKMGLNQIGENETLYILPTYSAMLEVRKILTGKKIL